MSKPTALDLAYIFALLSLFGQIAPSDQAISKINVITSPINIKSNYELAKELVALNRSRYKHKNRSQKDWTLDMQSYLLLAQCSLLAKNVAEATEMMTYCIEASMQVGLFNDTSVEQIQAKQVRLQMDIYCIDAWTSFIKHVPRNEIIKRQYSVEDAVSLCLLDGQVDLLGAQWLLMKWRGPELGTEIIKIANSTSSGLIVSAEVARVHKELCDLEATFSDNTPYNASGYHCSNNARKSLMSSMVRSFTSGMRCLLSNVLLPKSMESEKQAIVLQSALGVVSNIPQR
jgi:hypothetical protein